MSVPDAGGEETGVVEVGAERALGRQTRPTLEQLAALSFIRRGKERRKKRGDFIPRFFEAAKLKSVQIPPTFLLLHHHGALNLLDSKNDACYSLSSILPLSAE